MRLAKRILWVTVGVFVLVLWAAVVDSQATPIRPNLERILAQPQESVQFPMARAGWDGPPASAQVASSPTLDQLGPEASARAAQQSLKAAAIPDYRAVAGILLIILLLRRMQSKPKVSPRARMAAAKDSGLRRIA